MEKQMIHIAFCVNDEYVKYICVTIKSIIENNRDCNVCMHVLIDTISESNLKLLNGVVATYCYASLKVWRVNDKLLEGLKTGIWTKYAWYRILLPLYLPEDITRVLYLDADTVVTTDLTELCAVNMDNKAVAGVLDTINDFANDEYGLRHKKEYLCSGVLLLNLDYWRKYNLTHRIIEWAQLHQNKIKYPDQDAINYVCKDSKIILPLRYGILNDFFENNAFYVPPYLEQLKDCLNRPAIIHYAGFMNLPWIKEHSRHVFHYEWIKYNKMLKKQVKRVYETQGWNLVKVIIWRFFHPTITKPTLTLDDIRYKLHIKGFSNN